MKEQIAFFAFILLFCFAACSKNADGVFIRVENNTLQDFKEIIINYESFKDVDATEITSYQPFKNALSLPVATLITHGNDTTYAGISQLYYDWMEYLDNGEYTLRIFEDTTFTGFNCKYIKD